MRARGEDMQQRTTGRNQTRAAAIRTDAAIHLAFCAGTPTCAKRTCRNFLALTTLKVFQRSFVCDELENNGRLEVAAVVAG